ncbi:MAG: VOC family protein [Prevotellaceae bacterium]|jgi:lactoylglutathione lyase|nr:VOC family protein [Prevotellaceae bacterium]
MKISHISIYVNDLKIMDNFYEKYFNAKSNEMYFNPKTGLKTYRLSFDDGIKIEIMTKQNLHIPDKDIENVGYNHIAFSVGGRAEVDRITKWLEKDGYKIISYPHIAGDQTYESYVLDPEKNVIEIDE